MSSLELFPTNWRDLWQGHFDVEAVGAVYTRPEIVDLILDLAGFRPDAERLLDWRIVEPSCGDGAFLGAIVQRLVVSELRQTEPIDWSEQCWVEAIRAYDISEAAVGAARATIVDKLVESGCPRRRARQLSNAWAIQGDFLLATDPLPAQLVVGNPPYVRLEDLPKRVLAEYRSRFATLTDRADLYVAFIEHGLQLLGENGVLAYICANRFAKNQYGASLRQLIGRSFRVRHYVNLEHTQPFLAEVSAYPAIIAIDRQQGMPSRVGTLRDIEASTLAAVRTQGASVTGLADGPLVEFEHWYPKGEPWVTTSRAEFEVLAQLESNYPTLGESGGQTRVGIGVATGADDVFVISGRSDVVELALQIPLLMSADVKATGVSWSGHYLINPFSSADDGALVDLRDYVGLRRYLESRASQLKKRHVAKGRPDAWYRTIDRVWPGLQRKPKLLLPDIQRGGVVAIDRGAYYPHHNLYWVTSDTWDLCALQAVLRSSMVTRQVRAHSVQMRGGSLRYQAQTLRRLRVPAFSTLDTNTISSLVAVSSSTNQAELDLAVEAAFARGSSREFGAAMRRR